MKSPSELRISLITLIVAIMTLVGGILQGHINNRAAEASVESMQESYVQEIRNLNYQREQDSIRSVKLIEDWKKEYAISERRFQKNLELAEAQINALNGITIYNKQSQRPFFSGGISFKSIDSGKRYTDDELELFVEVSILNSGKRPASKLTIEFTYIDMAIASMSNYEKVIYAPNDIPVQQRFTQDYSIGHIQEEEDLKNIEGFYLFAQVTYKDPILRKRKYTQKFYFKWLGIQNGTIHQKLTTPYKEEILQMDDLLVLKSPMK